MKLRTIIVCLMVFLGGQWLAANAAEQAADQKDDNGQKKAVADLGKKDKADVAGAKKGDKSLGNPLVLKKSPADPIGDNLVGPEILAKGGAKAIGLTEEQESQIRQELEDVGARFKELQQQLAQEMEALGATLSPQRVDEKKALDQLDRVLDLEREIKRTHLQLAVMIKNKLTPEQLEKVREIKAEQAKSKSKGKPQPPPALQAKMEKLQDGLKQAKQEGRDLSALKPIMEELDSQLRAGNFPEAEKLIDKAFERLGEQK